MAIAARADAFAKKTSRKQLCDSRSIVARSSMRTASAMLPARSRQRRNAHRRIPKNLCGGRRISRRNTRFARNRATLRTSPPGIEVASAYLAARLRMSPAETKPAACAAG